ncbi:MAG: ornithine carbamoyltransferase [Ignavibacteriae bacterium]|nr:ornithine carbamoyltransferase [Ignavibacteriota bacterium]
MQGRDFLSVDDLSIQEIKSLFELAADMKRRPKKYRKALDGKILALIFEKPSLRTRTTFTVAIQSLGGTCVDYPPGDIGLGKRESVYDIAKNLERMVNGVMIRTFGQDIVSSFAVYASIPVINGLTDFEHPCQAMADFFTIAEHKKNIKKLKIAYIGDGNNVAHSLLLMAAKWGASMYVATPPDYAAEASVVQHAQDIAQKSGGSIIVTTDPIEAVRDADVIYTDTWTSMGQEAESIIRRNIFKPYQVNRELFSNAKHDALFMHCLPAHRGEEVTDEIIDSPNSVVFDEAENRLHVQKAILLALLGD